MKKVTFSQKIRYKFDNLMSKGPIAMMGLLAFISLVVVLLAAGIIAVFQISPVATSEPVTFGEGVWQSLMRSMDAGTVASDEGPAYRTLGLIVTIAGIFIFSALIGVLSNGINEKLEAGQLFRSCAGLPPQRLF